MNHDDNFAFCQCDSCVDKTAHEHRDADQRCGRLWVCQCAACKDSRTRQQVTEISEAFKRVEEAEDRLRRFKALREALEKELS